jgi:hypothetical protein
MKQVCPSFHDAIIKYNSYVDTNINVDDAINKFLDLKNILINDLQTNKMIEEILKTKIIKQLKDASINNTYGLINKIQFQNYNDSYKKNKDQINQTNLKSLNPLNSLSWFGKMKFFLWIISLISICCIIGYCYYRDFQKN